VKVWWLQVPEFYTKDHPEANGRTPKSGEHSYKLTFPLANGEDLLIFCGDETMERFGEMLGSMILDNQVDA